MLTNPVDIDLDHDVTLILSNDEYYHEVLVEACTESIRDDDAATNDPDAYAASYQGKSDDWYNFISCARLRVVDIVLDWVNDNASGVAKELLMQRLDIHNAVVWDSITESFMPDPDDV